MNGSGPLDFDATIDQKQFNLALDQMINRIKGVGDQAEKEGSKIDQSFRNAAAAVTAYFSLSFAKNMVTEIGQVRGEFQQLEIALETILKNKEKSDALMKDIVQFAAKTPFDLKGVASGAKQLLAYGTSAEDIIPTMRRLGDVAAGLSIPFGDLVYLYGTSATQGRIMTKDLMQFANRGIPIIDELSKVLDVSKSEVLALAGEGVIGFELLEEVIFNLTETTGMFGGMMEKQSASITGLASNLGDAWDTMLNKIGEANQSTYEGALKIAIDLVENYEAVLDILKVLVATYGTYRAAVILNTVAMKGYSSALGLAVIKQNLLNLAQKASPWGLALAGVTALIGGLWAYNKSLNKSRVELDENSESMIKQSFETEKLISKLKNANISAEERRKVLEELKQVNPEVTEAIKSEATALEDVIEKYNELNQIKRAKLSVEAFKVDNDFSEIKESFDEAQVDLEKERIRLEGVWVKIWDDFQTKANDSAQSIPVYVQKIFDEIVEEGLGAEQAIKKINDAYNEVSIKRSQFGKQNVSKNYNELYDYFYDIRKAFDMVNYSSTLNSFSTANENYKESLSSLETFIDSYTSSLIALSEAEKEKLNTQLKKEYIPGFKAEEKTELETVEEQLTVTKKIASLRKEIAEQQKQLQQLKSPESIYDSVKIKETEDSLSALKKELESIIGASEKVDNKSFSDTISEIKQTYENYYNWAKHYGKESADEQFKHLISGGKSFLEYLEKEISKYESKAKKTSTDRDNLSVLLATKDDVLGNKTQIDAFKEQIDQAKEEYRDLIDYIEFLKRTIESQGEWDGSEQGLQKLNILYQELNSAQKEFIRTSEDTYKQVTSDAADFAKRRIDIEQEYQDTVRKLDQSSLGSERYDEAIAAAEKIKDEKLKIITEEEVKSTAAYRRISQQIGRLTRNEAEKYIKSLRQQLTTLDDQSELYQEILKLIRDVEQGIKDQNIESLLKASDALRDGARFAALFDENLAAIIDTAAQVGEGIAKIASGDVLSGSLQVATSVFSSIINASDNAARKAEERQQRILDALQERLSAINELITRQIDLIDRLTGTDKLKGLSDGFRDLGFEMSKLLKQINEIDVHKSFNGHHYDVDLDDYIKTFEEIFGRRIGRTETFSSDIIERLIDENQQAISSLYEEILRGDLTGDKAEELKLLIEALEQQTEQFEDLKNDYNEYLTGSTAASIIDSIASGFEQGKTSAEDFADTFEELMRKAMLQALKMKALEGPLTAWYEDFAKLSEDGLTSEELEQLKNAYDYIISNASEQWEELQNILDQGNELQADTSLTGAIKGVTEETAGLIAGQMNAIRMNQAQSLVTMNNMLEQLSGIEYNTRNNVYIRRIYDLLESKSNDSTNSIRANGGY